MFTVDTNILIAYVGGEETVISQIKEWRSAGVTLFVSSITECEMLSYPKLSFAEEMTIENFLQDHFVVMPFDGFRAKLAAQVRRKISSLKLPDAAIAGLALETNTPLVTRNTRDFKKIPHLKLFSI
ncbi:type II toxin-antitoxin system VapC family toxin [Candidatus Saganbacteria bacterium]|uniref:Type II toxin-antitoxin system VapC family toxin n=1 Tax=Candidatus Saganbacteria bacterium TaxID=2575572 RepID=A0A9D6YVS7_UNCSA|nr:type II toxin-antitoxin system VapC family toxin [Candidatus Saganbacteria bacterium]